MSEIRTDCNDSCPYYYKNTGCLKPEGMYCPPQSVTYNIPDVKNTLTYQDIEVKIDEEIKKQEKVIIEYDNYAWKTQQLNTNFLIAVNIKNTLEKIKEWLENGINNK